MIDGHYGTYLSIFSDFVHIHFANKKNKYDEHSRRDDAFEKHKSKSLKNQLANLQNISLSICVSS